MSLWELIQALTSEKSYMQGYWCHEMTHHYTVSLKYFRAKPSFRDDWGRLVYFVLWLPYWGKYCKVLNFVLCLFAAVSTVIKLAQAGVHEYELWVDKWRSRQVHPGHSPGKSIHNSQSQAQTCLSGCEPFNYLESLKPLSQRLAWCFVPQGCCVLPRLRHWVVWWTGLPQVWNHYMANIGPWHSGSW